MKAQLLQYFFEKSPVAFAYHKVILDEHGFPCDYEFLDVNNAFEKMISLKASEVIGKRYSELFPVVDEAVNEWKEGYQDAIMNNKTVVIDVYTQWIQKWIRVTVFTLDKYYFICIFSDITKEYMQEKEIEGFLKVNIDMLCVANTDGNFLKVNKEFEKVLGYKVEELEGKNFLSLIHKDDVPATLEVINDLDQQKPIAGFINRFRCKNGSYRYLEWYAQPNGKYIYASARDVTEKTGMEEQLNKLVIIDELTGLLNRHFFDKRVVEEMERSDRYDEPLSMLILNLDNFKIVNDTWGHPVGDEVLKRTAEIVSSVIRKYDILVRLDDEEFVLLMPKTTTSGAVVVAEKIRKALDKNRNPIVGIFTASFGVAERMRSESFKSWYKRLDEALCRAKEGGMDRVVSADEQESLDVASLHFEWKSEWESGNKAIDEQHQELLGLANSLIYMSFSGEEFEKTMCQLDILIEHIVKHFNYEEQVLANIEYQDYDRHSKIHKNLVGKAFQLKEAYQNGELNSAAFFSFIVDDVVIGHIQNEDIKFFSYMRNRRVL